MTLAEPGLSAAKPRIVVTGSSRGLGAEVVRIAHQQGWDVCGLARTGSEPCDVLDPAALRERLADWESGARAGADMLVCCASAGVAGRLEHIDENRLNDPIRVDLEGSVNAVKAALPLLRLRPDSTIVLVSSMSSFHGVPGFATYSAAKAGLRAFAQALALEYRSGAPKIVLLMLGTLEGSGISETESWTADGAGHVAPARPFRMFRSASMPIPLAEVAAAILGPHRRSRLIYMPRSLIWLDMLSRYMPTAFRWLVRAYEARRLPHVISGKP